MSQLQIIELNGQLLVDSREVAEMIGKEHKHLLRDIKGYATIIKNSTSPKLDPLNFFLENTYTDGKGELRPSYLLTRKGCDMVANKMTGEKGVLFTAAYVTKFEEMQTAIKTTQLDSYMIEDPVTRAQKWIEEQKKRQQIETEKLMLEQRVAEYEPKMTYLDQILQSKSTVTITQIAKDYGLTGQQLNKILHEEKVQFKQNGQWLLYQKHQNCGYTKSNTIDVIHSNGDYTVKMNTRWTQKGRLFIHELLTDRGIVANVDRENVS